jgi:hypothetical protein
MNLVVDFFVYAGIVDFSKGNNPTNSEKDVSKE